MQTPSIAAFNVTCLSNQQSASQSVNTIFTVNTPGIRQNLTTSIVTYPYGTAPSLVPSTIYSGSSSGFLSFSAPPAVIETGLGQSSAQSSINVLFSPVMFNGGSPYSGKYSTLSPASISLIKVSLTNNSGIASAYLFFNGQETLLTGTGVLTATLSNVNLQVALAGIPIEVTATNSSKPTQNTVKVSVIYNYFYSFNGPAITCQ